MRTPQSILTSADVQAYCCRLLARHLRLADHGPTCTAEVVYAVLLFAASIASTSAHACRTLRDAPCDQSLYDALEDTLPARLELQRRLNRLLAATLPKAIRKGKRRARVAIDITLLPYSGRPDPEDDLVYRGQEKASTHYHPAYATAYLVRRGRRFTLAVRAVRHDDPWDDLVRSLLRQVRPLVPAIELVLLDRGFWSVAVIRYLQRARYPFLRPVVARGRRPDQPRGPSGLQVFCTWRQSGWWRYTVQQHNYTDQARVDIAVKVRRKVPRRPGSKSPPKRVLVYGCWGVRGRSAEWVSATYDRRRVEWVKQTYRGRFGIETSYRPMNQGRAWTTSRSPARRLLLVGVALILRNVWALLHLTVLGRRRRGGPELRPVLLTLAQLLGWRAEALRQLLGVRDRVELEHSFIL